MSFLKQILKARLEQNKDKYPLLKLNDLLDWTSIADIVRKAKKEARQDRRGKQGYDPLKMFKAILLGQWHSLSDPALEHALSVRIDFIIFCDFDDTENPDHATLCRYRQWLNKSDLLDVLMAEINTQLEAKQLKVRNAAVAVVDASIISSAGAPLRKALEVSREGEVSTTPASKDSDAKWVKKAGKFYLGYKLHARSDGEGYLEALPQPMPMRANISHHY